jgi:flagellar biosynthesis protein FlhG
MPSKQERLKGERRLGRGLSQVSHVFLSAAEKPEEKRQDADDVCLWMPDASYISVTSGERVRGKTLLAANLAFGLLHRGRTVAMVNADSGKPDLLDITGSTYSDEDARLARSNKAFGSLLAVDVFRAVGPSQGVDGASSPLHGIELAARQAQSVVIDTSPWAMPSQAIWRLARLVIVLSEPGVEEMRSSYATIKKIHSRSPAIRIGLVVNKVRSYAEADRVFRKISSVCRGFLKINPRNYGFIIHDALVDNACERMAPLGQAFPESEAARCINSILGLIMMDESAVLKRRTEVTVTECALREGR